MQRFFLLLICLAAGTLLRAQNVGIGTNTPHQNAILDVRSANKGILIPRISAVSRTAMLPAAKGMLVYDTTYSTFYYHDGGRWRPLHEYNADSALTDFSSSPQVTANMSSAGSTMLMSGILYDNGGPAGNYAANSNDEYRVEHDNSDDTTVFIGYKIVVEEMNTEPPYDSLEIFTEGNESAKKLISGNATGVYFIPYNWRALVFRFKSNNVNQLPGFKLRWTKLITSRSTTEAAPMYGWYYNQRKNAVRGGFNIADEWNTDSIGIASFGFGGNNRSIADGAVVFGYDNIVSGKGAFVAGQGNKVSAELGIALGVNTVVIGDRGSCIALGKDVRAGASRAIVIGDKSKATGESSIAIGLSADATNGSAVSIGEMTLASGYGSLALGKGSSATGDFSVGIGPSATASGVQAVAIGPGNTAAGTNALATGVLTRANGNHSFSANRGTIANGVTSVALGDSTVAGGIGAVAAGYKSVAAGNYSVALGYANQATGIFGAFATGYQTQALGTSSFAANYQNIAGGYYSFAAGESNNAAGNVSTAIGFQNTVNGFGGICIGSSSTVNGYWSRALGTSIYIDALQATGIGTKMDILSSAEGSFGLGDYEPGTNPLDYTSITTANQFVARFRGGYYFMSTANAPNGNINNRKGVLLLPGQSSWSFISDKNQKENFEPIDGEILLQKISRFHPATWNYKGQDPKTFRHYGPMAQDFFAAFGNDKYGVIGSDTLINEMDILGVSFSAIHALEKRTAQYKEDIKILRQELEMLHREYDQLKKK